MPASYALGVPRTTGRQGNPSVDISMRIQEQGVHHFDAASSGTPLSSNGNMTPLYCKVDSN